MTNATTAEKSKVGSHPGPEVLIPRSVLFSNPDKADARISPNGRKIAYLAPVDSVLNVWVGPADKPESAKPVTRDTYRGIRIYWWAYTSDHILYQQDEGGDENWRVYATDLKTGETRDLTPFQGVAAQVQEVSPKFEDEILVALNNREPRFHDVHRINIRTGRDTLIQQNDEFASFVTDDDYAVRLGLRMTPDGGSELLKRGEGGAWEPFVQIGAEDSVTTGPVGFDASGKTLYMSDSRGRNTAALISIDMSSGKQTVLAEDACADAGDTLRHPTSHAIQAVEFNYERSQWKVLDKTIEPDLAALRKVAEGDILVTSRSLDDQKWVVCFVVDNGPVQYFLYDRSNKAARFLFTNRKALEGMPLAKMHPVTIKSRDGLNLVSYLTLPLGSDAKTAGRPDQLLPMALLVHGGPWHRDKWGYNAELQWLANRGYAVLTVNFRASTGFGKNFINAGNKEWGRKMHYDLLDAVEWAVKQGVADKSRIAIIGGSYGGYATLAGLTMTPDVFACGVDLVGPSNLETLLNSLPAYWAPIIDLFTTRVGDHRTDDGRALLKERSPLSYVDRIKRPLLIGQGANDPRVKQSESDQIVKVMQTKRIPLTYVLYPDEGHGFARPENNMSFKAVTEAFLATYLGGRYESVGGDFKNATITVPTGAEQVPGLTAALPMQRD